jgi:hypothetical protein
MSGRGVTKEFFLDRIPVEPGDGCTGRRVMVARARPRASRSRAKNSMSARRAWNNRSWCCRHQRISIADAQNARFWTR